MPWPRRTRLAWCCAAALLVLPTHRHAAAAPVPFSGPVHSATGTLPPVLSVFASCAGRARIFGVVEQGLYRIDLPARTRCTVFVGEQDWEALPLAVEDAAVSLALPVLVYPRQVREPALARELLAMGNEDQALRGDNARPDDAGFLARMRVEDGVRQQRLAAIIARHGWPTLSMVGWEAANAAWLVAQHSPLERLKPWLALMHDAAARHEIAPYNLATSIDRVLVYENRKQVYGTQFRPSSEGIGAPYPTEDAAHLEGRRLRMGLPVGDQDDVPEAI